MANGFGQSFFGAAERSFLTEFERARQAQAKRNEQAALVQQQAQEATQEPPTGVTYGDFQASGLPVPPGVNPADNVPQSVLDKAPKDFQSDVLARAGFRQQQEQIQLVAEAPGEITEATGQAAIPVAPSDAATDIAATENPIKEGPDIAETTEFANRTEEGFPIVQQIEVLPPGKRFQLRTSLRNDFNKEAKQLAGAEIIDKLQKSIAGASQATAAGDVSLIFSFMKALDPASVVREGEQATAAQARGISDSVLNLYNRVVTGQKLTPLQRKEMLEINKAMLSTTLSSHKALMDRFSTQAQLSGIDPRLIVRGLPVDPKLLAQVPKLDFEKSISEIDLRAEKFANGVLRQAITPGTKTTGEGFFGKARKFLSFGDKDTKRLQELEAK